MPFPSQRHPRPRAGLPDPRLLAALALFCLVFGIIGLRNAAIGVVKHRIDQAAGDRDLSANWKKAELEFPGGVTLIDLALTSARGDTAFRAESLVVRVDPWSLIVMRPRLRSLTLARGQARVGGRTTVDPDTLAPEEPPAKNGAARSQRVRRTAERLVRLLLAPARDLPSVKVHDLAIESAASDGDPMGGARITWLDLRRSRRGIRLAAEGHLSRGDDLPFDVTLDYGQDDRVVGGARVFVDGPEGREAVRLGIDGKIAQDHVKGEARLEPGSIVTLGNLPLTVSGSMSRRGPRVRFDLAADGITQNDVRESLPRAVLGPLVGVSVRGSFDYRLRFDLDFERPDSVDFIADVIPHGLQLDPAGTRLDLLELHRPFIATIHLPRGVIARRELSEANPHFRPLSEIDPLLAYAVVTNEDGSFFRHRGFNTEAVKMSIAENLKAGAFRRGAGTITMQLVRNLYLGHEKTLSRKAQEVVLAWMLEHLTGLSKDRLLEIYLNIIEWGPGVHGADEATEYYFGHGAGYCSLGEALFLATVVPAPKKWRYRFDKDGELRHFARAQMRFIGRAMTYKGWLATEALPGADSLRVELRGPAGDFYGPAMPDSARERKEREFKKWFFDDKRSI
jgi:hypothetical protein